MLVPKLLLTPIKLGFLAQKRPNLVQNLHFWSFWAKYCHFCTFCPMPDQKPMGTRCLGWFSVMWVTKLLISPVKKGFFAQKRPNLAQNWHFGPDIDNFGPFDLMPDQKTMRTSCLCGFFIMWVPKRLLAPIKIRIFGPKTAKFGPKSAFLVILGQILPFFAHFVQCPTKNQCELGA